MASLPESSTFDAGVYQLELTDPVIGGPSGVSNAPLKNLANRTKYLKDHVDAIELNFAPKESPALTGTPTAPTAPAGTSTTQVATTEFAQSLLNGSVTNFVPSGAVVHFPRTSAPAGWLKANGAAVSRTTYAALFAIIGTAFGAGDGTNTFNLPDLRGEFIRSLDDSRGVDSGRAMGSAQADLLKAHYHEVTTSSPTNTINVYGDVGMSGSDDMNITLKDTLINPGTTGYAYQLMTRNTGGSETRPRNVALLACIKY